MMLSDVSSPMRDLIDLICIERWLGQESFGKVCVCEITSANILSQLHLVEKQKIFILFLVTFQNELENNKSVLTYVIMSR